MTKWSACLAVCIAIVSVSLLSGCIIPVPEESAPAKTTAAAALVPAVDLTPPRRNNNNNNNGAGKTRPIPTPWTQILSIRVMAVAMVAAFGISMMVVQKIQLIGR